MPFTLSHAVAVLPAMRRTGAARGPLIASALVLGSFAPDLPYFLGLWSVGGLAHSPPGVVTVDVVITLALFGFWMFAREPLVALLPARLVGRVVAVFGAGRFARRPPVSVVAWFAVSAAIGSATHIIWDAFTHAGRIGVRTFPILSEPGLFGYPWFSVLQYASSALGLAILAIYGVRLVRLESPERPDPHALPAAGTPSWPSWSPAWRATLLGLLAMCALVPMIWTLVRPAPAGLAAMSAFAAGAGLGAGLAVYVVLARVLWALGSRAPQPGELGRK